MRLFGYILGVADVTKRRTTFRMEEQKVIELQLFQLYRVHPELSASRPPNEKTLENFPFSPTPNEFLELFEVFAI